MKLGSGASAAAAKSQGTFHAAESCGRARPPGNKLAEGRLCTPREAPHHVPASQRLLGVLLVALDARVPLLRAQAMCSGGSAGWGHLVVSLPPPWRKPAPAHMPAPSAECDSGQPPAGPPSPAPWPAPPGCDSRGGGPPAHCWAVEGRRWVVQQRKAAKRSCDPAHANRFAAGWPNFCVGPHTPGLQLRLQMPRAVLGYRTHRLFPDLVERRGSLHCGRDEGVLLRRILLARNSSSRPARRPRTRARHSGKRLQQRPADLRRDTAHTSTSAKCGPPFIGDNGVACMPAAHRLG